jgi:hypothetical protein
VNFTTFGHRLFYKGHKGRFPVEKKFLNLTLIQRQREKGSVTKMRRRERPEVVGLEIVKSLDFLKSRL